jgi:transcriptional regulator with XRE-family HTH domain
MTKPTGDSTASVARAIGERVRHSRLGHGWTLDQLAQRSGLSRRQLVNVEQGTANPSIATLLQLSDALGIGLPALVDVVDAAPGAATVHRDGQSTPMWTSQGGGAAVLVAGTQPPDVTELWDWRLAPGDLFRSVAHASGTRELLLVLSGSVRLGVADEEHALRPGDSASFDASQPHFYANGSNSRPARFALTVHEPGVGAGGEGS